MLISSLLFLSLIVSSSIILLINPLSIGLAILLIALLLTLIFTLSMASWLAFLIFLIYVRGILVLFSYFAAITPNQTLPSLYITTISLSRIIPIYILKISLHLTVSINIISSYKINTLYIISTMPTLTLLAFILLITIIIIVKITLKFKGPLRPFNPYVLTNS